MVVVYKSASMSVSEQATMLYQFMKSKRLYYPEATLFKTIFKASKESELVFGNNIVQRTYNQDTIPKPAQLEKEILEAGRICSCVAAIDPEDNHRVSCTIMNEVLSLCAYDVESTEVLKEICKDILFGIREENCNN